MKTAISFFRNLLPSTRRGTRKPAAAGSRLFSILGAVFAGIFAAGCATEKPQYEAVLYVEAPENGIGQGFAFEQYMPAYKKPFIISKKPIYLPQHIADVVAVRANLDLSSGTQGFIVQAIPPPGAKNAVKKAPTATVKAPAAAAKNAPAAAKTEEFDTSFPALLVRLTPQATRHFLGDTLNISAQRRHIFLFVNGEPVGVYRTTGPVRNGEILFNHQLTDIPADRIDEALYALARDINKSIVLIQKELDSK